MTDRIRVLVVDDNDSVRRLLEIVLSLEDDLEVIGVACDADEAIEVAQRMPPDVVVLDHHMPGRTGLDILPELRALGAGAVVMYTADISPEVREAVQREGAQLCHKGGEPKELLEAVRRAAI